MQDLHPIQIEILKRLMYAGGLRHKMIKPNALMENSQFAFHINKLIIEGLVEKAETIYKLTDTGKEFANRMDISTKQFKEFPKITTMLCGLRDIGDKQEVLVYTRKKNPFYECQGFPTQKVLFGNNIADVAKVGFTDETSLRGEPIFEGIRHYRVYVNNIDLVEDKIMYIFIFKDPEGELKGCKEGDYFWAATTQLKEMVKNPLPEFQESLDIITSFNGNITFKEYNIFTNKF